MEKTLAVISDNPKIDFTHLTRIEYKGNLVLTTAQLAEFYGTNTANIKQNYINNKDRFIVGKHYFKVEGEELDILRAKNFYLQISPKTRVLYLWTKRGAARHCKSVGTNAAWDVFELLEDTYFSQPTRTDKPLESISDYERGKELARLARSARDPFIKRKLVITAANLIKGEKLFEPEPEQLLLQF